MAECSIELSMDQLLFLKIFPAIWLSLGSCFRNFSGFSYFFEDFSDYLAEFRELFGNFSDFSYFFEDFSSNFAGIGELF